MRRGFMIDSFVSVMGKIIVSVISDSINGELWQCKYSKF